MAASIERTDREHVILLHGLAAYRWQLLPLAWRLERTGFSTLRYGYPSLFRGVRHHAERFDRFLERFEQERPGEAFHLVVHSMGGIVTRALLERRVPQGLRRIVMLGTPNRGSHAARRLAPVLGAICPPLRELSDRGESLVHRLGEVAGIECGVIAARSDWVVALDATRLASAVDHQTVPGAHSQLLFRRDVAEMTANFLRTGAFVVDAVVDAPRGVAPRFSANSVNSVVSKSL
ncbi:MAG TPA: alpha/beta fold hydrolase [Pirellulaceae bacterium]|nr:alpha/beta fold hydrolase [Pirellulaceae bacterium]